MQTSVNLDVSTTRGFRQGWRRLLGGFGGGYLGFLDMYLRTLVKSKPLAGETPLSMQPPAVAGDLLRSLDRAGALCLDSKGGTWKLSRVHSPSGLGRLRLYLWTPGFCWEILPFYK
jgi:hypothetical protein